MKVLVTGGAGFIGAHTVRALLEAGHEVRVVDDLSTGRPEAVDVPLVRGDVRDQVTVWRALQGMDAVVHLAARSSVPASFRDPVAVESVNDLGSASILDCVWRTGVRKVVLASSAAVYGEGEPIDEATPSTPRSPYAASKVAMEALGRVYRQRGCQVATLRYFNVYGPGQRDGVVQHFLSALGGALPVHGDGQQSRDFVHVSDVARANVMALDWNTEVNIASGGGTSISELAELLADLAGEPDRRCQLPVRELDPACCTGNISRARSLGWSPSIDLATGLRELLLARSVPLVRDRAGGFL